MNLDAYRVRNLAAFVEGLNDLTRKHHVNICAYGPAELRIGDDNYVRLEWDEDQREYRVREMPS